MGFASATAGALSPASPEARRSETSARGPRRHRPPLSVGTASIDSVRGGGGDSSFFGLEPVAERLVIESNRRPREGGPRDLYPSWHVVPGLHHHRVHRWGRDHTLTFQGLDTAGGDNTALIDQIVVTQS